MVSWPYNYIEQINNRNMIHWSYGTSKWFAGQNSSPSLCKGRKLPATQNQCKTSFHHHIDRRPIMSISPDQTPLWCWSALRELPRRRQVLELGQAGRGGGAGAATYQHLFSSSNARQAKLHQQGEQHGRMKILVVFNLSFYWEFLPHMAGATCWSLETKTRAPTHQSSWWIQPQEDMNWPKLNFNFLLDFQFAVALRIGCSLPLPLLNYHTTRVYIS